MDEPPDDLTVETTSEADGRTVVRVAGELDIVTSQLLTAAVAGAVGQGATAVIVDMSQVTFMDSSGIAALIGAAATVPVAVRKPSEAVARLIDMTGLSGTVVIEP